ncbi:major facilitator superfamily domain-containing protein [Naematelia encephala]|uniref:Major facilitator superfamily domain-containing protein n=1 Tax=Naematelia encephala TaxID=71784 RepID=A0A1Y2B6K5_9TREE|nr:major facilitator superfamily domain-containing protein [Naematelia encephala]
MSDIKATEQTHHLSALERVGNVLDLPMDDNKDEMRHGGLVTVAELNSGDAAMDAETQFTDAEFNKLKRKVDWILLPLMWWCYGIQQTDKTGLSFMNVFGLQKSTHMVGQQYSLLTVVFYVGYACFEFPSSILMQRFNMGKVLAIFMFCWGVIVLCQAFLNDWSQFMALRFLQGMFECAISPGFTLLIANWYTTREHASRSLVFQSANAGWGVVVNLTMYGIASKAKEDPVGFVGSAPWRGIALFLGAQTLVASAISWFILGTPNEIRWLSKREKLMANARIIKNHLGTDLTGRKHWKWDQVKEAFMDPVLYFQFVNAFLGSVCNGALSTFGTVINASFGFTNLQVILYSIPQNVVSVCLFAIMGYTTLRWRDIRMWWMMASTVPPFVGMLGVALLPNDAAYKWDKWGCYLIIVTFVIPTFSALALITSNTAGRTKRTVMSSTVFIAYCTGNIAGSQVMQSRDAPHYTHGVTIIAILMAIEFITIVVWRFWLVHVNRKKAKAIELEGLSSEEVERRAQELGSQDVTDRKNPYFSYAL